jgi:chemotaxis protein methyltransferase CheR
MNEDISDVLLGRFSSFVADRTGLFFPGERSGTIRKCIISASREFGFKDPETCINWFLSSGASKSAVEILASHLTVGETYFFRESKTFSFLSDHILNDLIYSRRKKEKYLRIWSAGCCTGEEPYSVAILLSTLIPDIKDWNIHILATDINPGFLKKAASGTYGDWSFRDSPPWVKEIYFTTTKHGRFEIIPDIRRMVCFNYHNLAEDSYPSLINNTNAMDLILCRNVLMYFSPEKQRKVIKNLHDCLVDDGFLVVGSCEASSELFSGFDKEFFEGGVFYKKGSSKTIFHYEPVSIGDDFLPALQSVSALPVHIEKPQTEIQGNDNEAKKMLICAREEANQGNLSDACGLCEKAIASDRLDPASYYLLAIIKQEQGKPDEAASLLNKTIYLDQNFVLAHFSLGNLYKQKGNQKTAKKHFANEVSILNTYAHEEILPESDGIAAGRLREIINACRE